MTDPDFVEISDFEQATVTGTGYGVGAYGAGPFGGAQTVIFQETHWTEIDE